MRRVCRGIAIAATQAFYVIFGAEYGGYDYLLGFSPLAVSESRKLVPMVSSSCAAPLMRYGMECVSESTTYKSFVSMC